MKVHEHRVHVRYAETDQMGVVYHANYLVWMDEARTRLLDALGFPYAGVEREGIGLAVRRCEVRYRAPAVFGDVVVVRTRVLRVRGASVAFGYELEREADGTRLASASVELACTSLRDGRRPTVLPEPVRKALEGHVADPDAAQAPGGGSKLPSSSSSTG